MIDAIDQLMMDRGLAERPFVSAPETVPEAIFWSPEHKRARAALDFGLLARAPLLLLTGDVGCGKTTLANHVVATATDTALAVGRVTGLRGRADALMTYVLATFGLEIPDGEADRIEAFTAFLLDRYAAGERTLLIVEEAQALPDEAFDTLLSLTGVNTAADELVQILLIGDHTLRARLEAPAMTHIAQKVGAAAHLDPMSEHDCVGYLEHRLRWAGAEHALFTDHALRAIALAAGGVARIAGQLAEIALIAGPEHAGHPIGAQVIQDVVEDRLLLLPHSRPANRAVRLVA
jgi:type II secretory pathway predicted ATPase ExeA